MALSILGGLLKGHKLSLPSNQIVRPTAASLKRKVFDAYQTFDSDHFYDLCSGSGSIGIEAWSRGAASVTCVEGNKKAYGVLADNCKIAKGHYPDEIKERPLTATLAKCEKWLSQNIEQVNTVETIIYLDPPYEKKETYVKVINILKDHSFCGELWLESCSQKGSPSEEWCEMLKDSVVKVYEQGSAYIIRFKFAV